MCKERRERGKECGQPFLKEDKKRYLDLRLGLFSWPAASKPSIGVGTLRDWERSILNFFFLSPRPFSLLLPFRRLQVMLREKSNNTPLTTWLSQSSKGKQSASTTSTLRSERGYENNKEKEEEDLQQAIEQSRKDYKTQQKQQYNRLSSLYSTANSSSAYMIPSIDDDEAWFQSTPPMPATSPSSRPLGRAKLSLTTKRPPLSKGKSNSDKSSIPTASPKLVNQQVDDGQDTAVLKKEEDEETWTIDEDESWEIQSSQPEVKMDPSSWEISAMDDDDNDITHPNDEMDEYMSAIRTRSTKTIPASKQPSIRQENSTPQQQKRRPATLLDDVFNVITKDHDSPKSKKKVRDDLRYKYVMI